MIQAISAQTPAKISMPSKILRALRRRLGFSASLEYANKSIRIAAYGRKIMFGRLNMVTNEPFIHASSATANTIKSVAATPNNKDLRIAFTIAYLFKYLSSDKKGRTRPNNDQKWWSYRDSNPGPLPCHGSALAN